MIPFDLEESSKRMYLHLRRKENLGAKCRCFYSAMYCSYVSCGTVPSCLTPKLHLRNRWKKLYSGLLVSLKKLKRKQS